MRTFTRGLAARYLLLAPALTCFLSLIANAGQGGSQAPGFTHGPHLEQEMECVSCHAEAPSSTCATEDMRPPVEVCEECHEEDSEEIRSASWAAKPKEQTVLQRIMTELIFSHEAHMARDLDCEHCHLGGEAAQADVQIPLMEKCFMCHEGRGGVDDCAVCHSGVGILRPSDHDVGWVNHHGEEPRGDDSRCQACHNSDYCQECHEGGRLIPTEKAPRASFLPYGPQVAGDEMAVERAHDLNYRFTHSLDAVSRESECRACHQYETFCSDCHSLEGDPSQSKPRWHGGPYWGAIGGGVGTGGGEHAEMARGDIELCASCHEVTLAGTDPTCLTCHRDFTLGRGNDPRTHDPGFAGDAGRGEWHEDDGAICYVCHARDQAAGDAGFCGYCHDSNGGD